jgi:hypothetical protein
VIGVDTRKWAATERADRIRAGIVAYAETQAVIAEAYRSGDWSTLGYSSWAAYIGGEFGPDRVKLSTDQRRALTSSLHTEGVSIRAISTALGVARNTVRADLRGVGQSDPPSGDEEAWRQAWWALTERIPDEALPGVMEMLDVSAEAVEMAVAVQARGDEALNIAVWYGQVPLEDAYRQVTTTAVDPLREEIERLATGYGVVLDAALLDALLANYGGDR